jgi:hypothetical protein
VTGSCVNTVLAISGLIVGISCGITTALLSPILACLLGIAPQVLVVPAIMIGNVAFVLILCSIKNIGEKKIAVRIAVWLLSAFAKFMLIRFVVVDVICSMLSEFLYATGHLKEGMATVLAKTFSWPQLITALIGAGIAFLIVPRLRTQHNKLN